VQLSLVQFLRTGNLGPIRLGMTAVEVEAVLGKPDATGNTSRKHRWPSVWRYGDVEFGFDPKQRLLVYLSVVPPIDSTGGTRFNQNVRLDTFGVDGSTSPDRLEHLLAAHNVPYVRRQSPEAEEGYELLVSGQVLAIFRTVQATGERCLEKLISFVY
jgi:hypothetical protein